MVPAARSSPSLLTLPVTVPFRSPVAPLASVSPPSSVAGVATVTRPSAATATSPCKVLVPLIARRPETSTSAPLPSPVTCKVPDETVTTPALPPVRPMLRSPPTLLLPVLVALPATDISPVTVPPLSVVWPPKASATSPSTVPWIVVSPVAAVVSVLPAPSVSVRPVCTVISPALLTAPVTDRLVRPASTRMKRLS